MADQISLRPSEMVEGGAVPVDQNLTWTKCRFEIFDYQGKAEKPTTAAHISFQTESGDMNEQFYSVGSPDRFIPSKDGKTLVAVGTANALSKSSNFYLLMNALINAGYDESLISNDISTLDGLVAYHIGMPEPKRSGMAPRVGADGQPAREKIISVPSQIVTMPGEKKGKAGAKKAAGGASLVNAVAFASAKIDEEGSATRQELAASVYGDYEGDDKKEVAGVVFTDRFLAAMTAAGYTVDGEEIKTAD